jgi:HKD family nuclease
VRDERIAMEDLSDRQVVGALIERRLRGFHDEVLVKCERNATSSLLRLHAAGVDVRALLNTHLHEKYVDAGDRIYIGSTNLTRNGLDESREIGLVANAADFGDGADALRADFDRMWRSAQPVAA